LLAQARFEKKKTISITDLPLIVFGGIDPVTQVLLKNAFEEAFNKDQCLSAWRKCGAVPLARSVLNSPDIRHEVILNPNKTINEEMDPEGYKLLEIESSNHQSCDFLSLFGFDGRQLRLDAPRKSTKKYNLTEPQSKARIEQIQKAQSAGQMFHVTHGQHLNSDDFFAARAKTNRDKDVKDLEKKKKELIHKKKKHDEAMRLLELKWEPTDKNLKNDFSADDMALLAHWKAGKTVKGKWLTFFYFTTTTPCPNHQLLGLRRTNRG